MIDRFNIKEILEFSLWVQCIFGVTVIVILCLLIRQAKSIQAQNTLIARALSKLLGPQQ